MDDRIQALLASRPDFNAEEFAARRILRHWGLVGKAVKAEMKDRGVPTAWALACLKLSHAMSAPDWPMKSLRPYALAETDRAAVLEHIVGLVDSSPGCDTLDVIPPVALFVRGAADTITVFVTIMKSCVFTGPAFNPPMTLFPLEDRDDMVIMSRTVSSFLEAVHNNQDEGWV